ncbi:MAG: UDP-2,3-diacylglucosamine diphosphatase [Hyphomicrobiales bacterium]
MDDIHTGVDGKRYLVMHGDEFDGAVKYAKWLAYLGDTAYETAISVNAVLNRVRRYLGLPYWSLSAYLKNRVKKAVEFLSNFEHAMVHEAKRRGTDGVICGHVHTPEMRVVDDVVYFNDGDWVESCSALVEHFDGRFELIHWAQVQVARRREEPANAHSDGDRRLVSTG